MGIKEATTKKKIKKKQTLFQKKINTKEKENSKVHYVVCLITVIYL